MQLNHNLKHDDFLCDVVIKEIKTKYSLGPKKTVVKKIVADLENFAAGNNYTYLTCDVPLRGNLLACRPCCILLLTAVLFLCPEMLDNIACTYYVHLW